jgi:hypothetical protein
MASHKANTCEGVRSSGNRIYVKKVNVFPTQEMHVATTTAVGIEPTVDIGVNPMKKLCQCTLPLPAET